MICPYTCKASTSGTARRQARGVQAPDRQLTVLLVPSMAVMRVRRLAVIMSCEPQVVIRDAASTAVTFCLDIMPTERDDHRSARHPLQHGGN